MGKFIRLSIGSCGLYFCIWAPIAKNAMFVIEENPSFLSRPKMMILAMGKKGWGPSLDVIIFHESNEIYGSSIQVSSSILWWVETRFLKPFRDPTYNWFQVLKPKKINGLRVCKFEKLYLGIGKFIRLCIGSYGPSYFMWPPIAKISMCLTQQNPSF